MKRFLRWSAAGIAAAALTLAARESTPAFSAERYVAHIRYLASPELEGRGAGTAGLEKAAKYIEKQFRSYGLKPLTGKSLEQDFTLTVNARLGDKTSMSASGRQLKPKIDFQPLSFSGTGPVEGEVAFAGYGITAPEYRYDDYAGIDVKNKWVLVLRHEPQEKDERSVFNGKNFTSHAQYVNKAIAAKMHGALGLIILNDKPSHPTDPDTLTRFGSIEGPANAGLPVIEISTEEGERWLAAAGRKLDEIILNIDHQLKPSSFALPPSVRVAADVEIERDVKTVHNVVAFKPGETGEYVIIGAHYDHLGMGGSHSLAPDQHVVHPGADDNASGTAGLLELARWFSRQPKQKRGVLFLAFAGEELGLLGSQFYADHPLLPLDQAAAMINLDMIGRMKDLRVFVSGTGTGSNFAKLVDEAVAAHDIKVDLSEKAGYGASDHSSFTAKQVPVLFFFSGLHSDYHRPSDTWDKIDGPATAQLLGLVSDVARRIAGGGERAQFVKVAPAPVSGVGGGTSGYGAYFGSIPDFAEIPDGVRFADVKEGSPAALAGLKAKDVLIEFDGKKISNLYDFTYALRAKKPGDEVPVKVVRDGKTIEAKVLLTDRK